RRRRSWFEPAVELRHRKISACLAQDLIGLTQFAVFSLERLDPLALIRRRARASARIALRVANPVPQRLARAADLRRNRRDCGPLRRMIAPMLLHHPNRPSPDLRREFVRGLLLRFHDPILSRVGASGKPGAVQTIKDGGTPEDWKSQPAKNRQKDKDARW